MSQQISKLLSRFGLVTVGVGIMAAFLVPQFSPAGGTVYAADPLPPCKLGQTPKEDKCSLEACDPSAKQGAANACACDPALVTCNQNACSGNDCGIIRRFLNPIIFFLGGIVGIVATIAIIIGGIQYSASADDPQKVAAAKGRIINALLALLAYVFLWAFLEWLVPGGVFGE